VLLVGLGGLGCPAALALVRAGIAHLGLCDDDEVERTNLHRQILFGDADVGAPKLDAGARALERAASSGSGSGSGSRSGSRSGASLDIRLHRSRLTPANAASIVAGYDVVLEGSDNFATKFLAADACALAGIPVVHASAVRWVGTVLAVGATQRPCYRCLFEAPPDDEAPGCSEAGVMGPVVGVVAAVQADLALGLVDGLDGLDGLDGPAAGHRANPGGELVTFDGRTDALRRRRLGPRRDCALCGVAPSIRLIEPRAYETPAFAG
jgi:molybdopterin/thiamine biosynthesis adenylyltransferase